MDTTAETKKTDVKVNREAIESAIKMLGYAIHNSFSYVQVNSIIKELSTSLSQSENLQCSNLTK